MFVRHVVKKRGTKTVLIMYVQKINLANSLINLELSQLQQVIYGNLNQSSKITRKQ